MGGYQIIQVDDLFREFGTQNALTQERYDELSKQILSGKPLWYSRNLGDGVYRGGYCYGAAFGNRIEIYVTEGVTTNGFVISKNDRKVTGATYTVPQNA